MTDLTLQLAAAFQSYRGKDSLLIVVKDVKKATSFAHLEQRAGAKKVQFDQLCPPPLAPVAATTSKDTIPDEPASTQSESFSPAETEAVIRLQQIWRFCSARIRARREWMLLPKAQTIQRFIGMGRQCPATLSITDRVASRYLLVSKGVDVSIKLEKASESLRTLDKEAMDCVEKVEISEDIYKAVDEILEGNRGATDLVTRAADEILEESIIALVRQGNLYLLRRAMIQVDDLVQMAESQMLETRERIYKLSKGSKQAAQGSKEVSM